MLQKIKPKHYRKFCCENSRSKFHTVLCTRITQTKPSEAPFCHLVFTGATPSAPSSSTDSRLEHGGRHPQTAVLPSLLPIYFSARLPLSSLRPSTAHLRAQPTQQSPTTPWESSPPRASSRDSLLHVTATGSSTSALSSSYLRASFTCCTRHTARSNHRHRHICLCTRARHRRWGNPHQA